MKRKVGATVAAVSLLALNTACSGNGSTNNTNSGSVASQPGSATSSLATGASGGSKSPSPTSTSMGTVTSPPSTGPKGAVGQAKVKVTKCTSDGADIKVEISVNNPTTTNHQYVIGIAAKDAAGKVYGVPIVTAAKAGQTVAAKGDRPQKTTGKLTCTVDSIGAVKG